MDSRFTFKDFVFAVLFLFVIGAVVWVGYQFGYQESRLNDVKTTLAQMGTAQKEQLGVLTRIEKQLREGVAMRAGTPGTSAQEATGRIRRTNPDGSLYVYYPDPPKPPRDPHDLPDYAPGDWLVYNLGDEPKVVTPFIEKDYYGQLAQVPVMESLLTQNPETFAWEPFLAESYNVSADGLKITFTLRRNVCFSDGSPIRPEDVLFSYHTVENADVDCAPLRGYFELIKDVKKVDDRTVEFDFSEPYFKGLEIVGGMLILPEHAYKFKTGEEYNNRSGMLVGSGPYRLQSWDKGQQLVYVRNERYWGERPTYDQIIMKFIKNPQAALQDFENNQLDLFSPNPDQWVKFTGDPEFMSKFTTHKYLRPDAGYMFIGYNEMKPMFGDKETRQALTMLIDRTAIIHTFFKDMAVPITSPFNPLSPQDDKSIEPWPYDPAKAKSLLASAGWKPGADGVLERDGKPFTFSLMMGTGNPLSDRIANYIKEQLTGAGIRVEINPLEFAIVGQRLDAHDFDAIMMGWSGSLEEDPNQIWDSASIENKGSNYISFRNKESDALIEQGRRTLDTDKRMKIWHKWQALIHDEQPYTFIATSMSRIFIQKRFKNTEPYKTGIAQYDWYVPAADQKYK
ncbi:MAG TPA: peptide-binding protein [Phycisphaerae bacterium]|nr:peptide-binding protein [Phycisphaerae bacterium]